MGAGSSVMASAPSLSVRHARSMHIHAFGVDGKPSSLFAHRRAHGSGDGAHLAGCGAPDGECGESAEANGDPEGRLVAAGAVMDEPGQPRTDGAADDAGQHQGTEDGPIVATLEDLRRHRTEYRGHPIA